MKVSHNRTKPVVKTKDDTAIRQNKANFLDEPGAKEPIDKAAIKAKLLQDRVFKTQAELVDFLYEPSDNSAAAGGPPQLNLKNLNYLLKHFAKALTVVDKPDKLVIHFEFPLKTDNQPPEKDGLGRKLTALAETEKNAALTALREAYKEDVTLVSSCYAGQGKFEILRPQLASATEIKHHQKELLEHLLAPENKEALIAGYEQLIESLGKIAEGSKGTPFQDDFLQLVDSQLKIVANSKADFLTQFKVKLASYKADNSNAEFFGDPEKLFTQADFSPYLPDAWVNAYANKLGIDSTNLVISVNPKAKQPDIIQNEASRLNNVIYLHQRNERKLVITNYAGAEFRLDKPNPTKGPQSGVEACLAALGPLPAVADLKDALTNTREEILKVMDNHISLGYIVDQRYKRQEENAKPAAKSRLVPPLDKTDKKAQKKYEKAQKEFKKAQNTLRADKNLIQLKQDSEWAKLIRGYYENIFGTFDNFRAYFNEEAEKVRLKLTNPEDVAKVDTFKDGLARVTAFYQLDGNTTLNTLEYYELAINSYHAFKEHAMDLDSRVELNKRITSYKAKISADTAYLSHSDLVAYMLFKGYRLTNPGVNPDAMLPLTDQTTHTVLEFSKISNNSEKVYIASDALPGVHRYGGAVGLSWCQVTKI